MDKDNNVTTIFNLPLSSPIAPDINESQLHSVKRGVNTYFLQKMNINALTPVAPDEQAINVDNVDIENNGDIKLVGQVLESLNDPSFHQNPPRTNAVSPYCNSIAIMTENISRLNFGESRSSKKLESAIYMESNKQIGSQKFVYADDENKQFIMNSTNPAEYRRPQNQRFSTYSPVENNGKINFSDSRSLRKNDTMVYTAPLDGSKTQLEIMGKRRVNRQRSTNIQELGYFKEEQQSTKKLTPHNLTHMNYHVRWHWSQFIEFLAYHFIFFFITGPFTVFALGYKPGVLLLRNMEFYGNTLVFYVQCFIYMTNVYCSVQYFLDDSHQIHMAEIFYLWALIFNVCLIISAKYATFSPEMILVFKTCHLEIANKKKLQYMHFHTPQSDEARYVELWAAFKRHEFEAALFYLSFFVSLDRKLEEQITQNNENLKVFHNIKWDLFQPEPLIKRQKQQLYGFGILNTLIQAYENQSSWKMMLLYAWMLSLLMSLIPILYRAATNTHHVNGYQLFFFIFMVISETYCGFICLIFLITSLRDIRKKKFLLVQCGFMLSPSKARWSEKKLIPTLDITDPQSVMAWSMLRQISLDYGRQYTIRTQAFYSFIICYCVATSFSITLYFFGVVNIDKFTMIYLSSGAFIFFILLLMLFSEQAALNYFFEEYKNIIEDWINIVQDVQRMQFYYFDQEIIPNNFLHKRIVEEVMDHEDADIGEYLERIKQTFEDALRHLNYDERNNSFKFYGIIVTYERLWALLVAIGTMVGFTINYWIDHQ